MRIRAWTLTAALVVSFGSVVWAQEEDPAPLTNSSVNRDPAQDSVPGHIASEDDLKVQAQLPDAVQKHDARTFQSDVYKTMFNKELKPDQREDALDE